MQLGRTANAALWLLVLAATTAPASAEDVPPALRDTVEDSLSSNFIRPATAIWQFDSVKPYTGDSRVVCGAVNYQSAGQKYVGFHSFYAIVSDNTVTLAQVADPTQDLSGELANKLKLLCGKD